MLRVLACAAIGLPAGWAAALVAERAPQRRPLWPPRLEPGWRAAGVVVATVAAFAAAGWAFPAAPPLALAVVLVLFAGLAALTAVDIEHQRLPDAITAPLYLAVLAGVVISSVDLSEPARIRQAIIGGLVWIVCLGLGWLMGMGFGDVKAGGIMGMVLGWAAPGGAEVLAYSLYALLIGMLAASAYGIVDLVRRRLSGADSTQRWFALGPFLVLGTVAVLLVQP